MNNNNKANWEAFVSNEALEFFNSHELTKMSMATGEGGKATLTRQKDDSVKVEIASTSIID